MIAAPTLDATWFKQNRVHLFCFLLCTILLCAGTFLVDEPIILYSVAAFCLVSAASLFLIENALDCLLLLAFVFSVDLLFLNIGSAGILAVLGVVVAIALIRSFAQGFEDWKEAVFVKPLLIFIFVVFLSLFWGNPFMGGSTRFVINLLVGFVIFYITHFSVSSFKSLHFLTLYLIFLLAGNALYGIYYHLTSGGRAASFFLDTPTYSGHYFVQGIALSMGAYLSPVFHRLRPLLMTTMVLLLLAVILTFTRGAWLALLFLGFISLFVSKILKKYLVYSGVAIALIIFVFNFVFTSSTASAIFRERLSIDISNAYIGVGSIAFRVLLWQSAWTLFLSNPLLGAGFDNFVTLNRLTPNYPIIQGLGGSDLYVHNIYLQILAETGIIGFSIFLFLILRIYKHFFRAYRVVKDSPDQYVLLGHGWVMTLWLFMGLTEGNLYTPVTATFFFFTMGILSGIHKLLSRQGTPV